MTFPRIVFLALLMGACSVGPERSNVAYFDFSGAPADLPAPLRALDVSPSSWMSGNAMYYRLAYADDSRREHYVESRWTAQPAELLGVRLQRSLMSAVAGETLCRLRIELDDLTQVFDTRSSSRLVLEGRATLYGPQQSVLARRSLGLSHAAGGDARAGVAASGPLADALARELQGWVRQECRKR